MKTDLIIIGAGPGGYECAVKAAREGLTVVIVEAKAPGGTCLNEGCIPTKCLCHTAQLLKETKEAASNGINCPPPAFDLTAAMARKAAIVKTLGEGIMKLMQTPGITYVSGVAQLASAHTVHVGEDTYEAENIIIATGSEAKRLPVPGCDLPRVITSSEMLALAELPRRLCVIGGGVVGLEFASIFAAFGSEVTVVEYCKEVLPNFDRDIAKRLRLELKKQGIVFKTGAAVTGIEESGDETGTYLVRFEEKGKASVAEADLVLMAVGRKPRTEGLGLEALGIATDRRGIVVDDNMETSVKGIYAVGDVNGRCPLAHAATFQSYRALNHIQGRTDNIRFDIIPAAVFTVPELASVGLTEEECATAGQEYAAHKAFYRSNGKALTADAGEGLVKILTAPDGKIIGATILGLHASDLIHEISVAMNFDATIDRLRDIIHAHPTLSEIVLAAADN